MNRDEFRKLDVAGRLPTPNGVAVKLLRMQRGTGASLQEIAGIVKGDPALAGRIIGAANALAADGTRPVASAHDAVMRIGVSAACQMALGLSVVSRYRTGRCAGFDYGRFWAHSLLMGITMHALAARTKIVAAEEAFTLGLLAHIGYLALATLFPDRYSETHVRQGEGGAARIAAERAAFATDHVELSEHLLAGWGFPERLIDPIVSYGRDASGVLAAGSRRQVFTESLLLSDLAACTALVPAEGAEHIEPMLRATTVLDLAPADLTVLADEVAAAWPAWARMLEVDDKYTGRVLLAPRLDAVAPPGASNAPSTPAVESFVPRTLVVSSDEAVRVALQAKLSELHLHVDLAADDDAALRETMRLAPHVILLHWRDGAPDPLALCRTLRQSTIGNASHILVLSEVRRERALVDALDAGADDLVAWPAPPDELRARMRAVCRNVSLQHALVHDRDDMRRRADAHAVANRRLREASRSDPLTGLPNRRYAMDQLEFEWELARNTGGDFCCLMIDIDDFKRVNDSLGHAVGDEVLTRVAGVLGATARSSDSVCRIGGDEFVVICRNSVKRAAFQCAERLRLAVERDTFTVGDRRHGVTISVGVAANDDDGVADRDTLLEAADRALYRAKRDGRNRVVGTS